MHFPTKIIFEYNTFRNGNEPVTVPYTILFSEQQKVIEKLDFKNIVKVDDTASILVLQLDVNIYDVALEVILRGILNTLFSKSSINNDKSEFSQSVNNKLINSSYEIREIAFIDLFRYLYQLVKTKGHFSRDMKKISEKWEIARQKSYFAVTTETLGDEDIENLQTNRIHSNNDEVDLYKHFSIEQEIYNYLYSVETQNSDKYYFIYYRIKDSNIFYKFVMTNDQSCKELQGKQDKYNYERIDFDEAIDRCNLLNAVEWDSLESLTKEQIEAIISNFVLIRGGKKRFKDYIESSNKKYDWNLQLDIATLKANQSDSSCAVKCSDFCPFYENCRPIKNSMIETMKNKKPLEEKAYKVEYTEFYQARQELKELMERIIL